MTHPAQVGTRSLVPRRRSPTLQHQGSFLPLVPSTLLLSQEPCNNHQLSAYNLPSTGGCCLLFFKLHRTDTNPLEAAHLYLKHHRTQDFSPPLAESRYETVTKKIKYIYLNIFFFAVPSVSVNANLSNSPQLVPAKGTDQMEKQSSESFTAKSFF